MAVRKRAANECGADGGALAGYGACVGRPGGRRAMCAS
ncbi:hypothetical protein BUH_7156 [Burkholderia pseudomallei Pakistan 9]|nr:hypothetical protein BUC_7060 [Burkholderia pseudomallei 576]EEH26988.1 hypothetical protein BUH_7156 [Burkholderia pseudomallei Pakistan 9]